MSVIIIVNFSVLCYAHNWNSATGFNGWLPDPAFSYASNRMRLSIYGDKSSGLYTVTEITPKIQQTRRSGVSSSGSSSHWSFGETMNALGVESGVTHRSVCFPSRALKSYGDRVSFHSSPKWCQENNEPFTREATVMAMMGMATNTLLINKVVGRF